MTFRTVSAPSRSSPFPVERLQHCEHPDAASRHVGYNVSAPDRTTDPYRDRPHATTDQSDQIREIIFEVTEAPEGGSDARALGHSVFTQGDDWDDLKDMVRDAVLCHFDDRETPRVIRLHFVREEAIAV